MSNQASTDKRQSFIGFLRKGGIGKTLAKILPDAPWATYLLCYRVFKRVHGFAPRLSRPRTLNEWLFVQKVKLPRSTTFAHWVDKHLAKKTLEKALKNHPVECKAARTIHYTTSADDAFFNGVIPRCVIKGTHGSAMTILVESPRLLTPEEKGEIRRWLSKSYFWGSREPSYRHVVPGVIAEEFLPSNGGIVPDDYRFYCFNGKIAFIQHETGRHLSHRRRLYSTDWQRLNVTTLVADYEEEIGPPQDLETMMELARILSKDEPFVRVDFYQTDEGVYFGEMTFFPASGLKPFSPASFDAEIYERWMTPSSEHALAA